MKRLLGRFALVASGFVLFLGLGVGSASALTFPFYLTPGGSPGVSVTPGAGATAYQLWVDPSAITGGTFGFDWDIYANGSLTMTAFAANPAALLTSNLASPTALPGQRW